MNDKAHPIACLCVRSHIFVLVRFVHLIVALIRFVPFRSPIDSDNCTKRHALRVGHVNRLSV